MGSHETQFIEEIYHSLIQRQLPIANDIKQVYIFSPFSYNSYLQRVQMLERLLWIVADESYYEDETTKAYLPSRAWFITNKYCLSSDSTCFFELIFKREILVQSCHFYSKMCAQLRTHSKKKTKERNTKNILIEQDRWIEVDELMSVTMREYQEVMQLDEISSMLSFFETPLFLHLLILF